MNCHKELFNLYNNHLKERQHEYLLEVEMQMF